MLVLAGLGGLIFGSFFNVVAYRMPRGESLSVPGSHCPSCGTPIKAYDNVPVIGWLMLRGKCRTCHARISPRYPLVEALTALLVVVVVLVKSSPHDVALGLGLVAVLMPIALIDYDHQLIPNRLTAPGALAALVIGLVTRPAGAPEQLIAAAAAGGFLLFFAIAYPKGMGMGDVKLAAMLGLFLGREVAVAVMVGVIAGVVVGSVVMARLGVERGRKVRVPFGPFLATGGIVALLAGAPIVHWYLQAFA